MEYNVESYLDMMRFLNESSDDYFFLWEFATGRLFLPPSITEKYSLPLNEENYCAVEDWVKIVFPKDVDALVEDLGEVRQGKRLVHDMVYRLVNRRGEIVWISCRGKCGFDQQGNLIWMVGRVSDTLLANDTDRLTGAFYLDRLLEELNQLLAEGKEGYLVLLDIRGLQNINLQFGRNEGDKVLKITAEALEEAIGNTQKVYRMNGGCFGSIFLCGQEFQVKASFSQLQEKLGEYCAISGGCVPIHHYRTKEAVTLYQYAESALDQAKRNGKKELIVFSEEDYEKKVGSLALIQELKQDIQEGFRGFSLHYQPQVATQNPDLHGAEALLRYESRSGERIPPDQLIPVLEQTGMICQVGLWVLETALRQCKKWRKVLDHFHISVNVSYTQLLEEGVENKFLQLLKEVDLPGDALTLEVTESMQIHDYPVLNHIFEKLKQEGVQISVDDFGTGYSSLSRLKDLQIDEIKVDRCFITNIHEGSYNYHLVSNVVEMAAKSNMQVCCEGVETEEELGVLKQINPCLLQGYLFSRPLPAEDFEEKYLSF